MSLPTMGLPTPVTDAIRDLCAVIGDNISIRDGFFRAGAARLAKRIDDATASGEPLLLSGEEIELAVDIAESVATAILNGKSLAGSAVLMRVCERVVNPITDALGYRQS